MQNTSKSFDLKVYLYNRPDLMDEGLEYEAYMGMSCLKTMFKTQTIDTSVKSLFLSFPERWLNIIQQRCLYARIERYLPNCKKVEIKTHSPFILQCTAAKDIGIVNDGPNVQESVDGQTAFAPSMNLFDPTKLNVVGNDIKQF